MCDLQVAAFRANVTRVFAFKLGRDGSNRVFPESGSKASFHEVSHHGDKPQRIEDLARINAYHVGLMAHLLGALRDTPAGDAGGSLLDHTLVLYGSPMGDPNLHNHRKVPFFLAGHAGGAIRGGQHIRVPDRTPLANAMLSVLQVLGFDTLERFGDSTGAVELNAVRSSDRPA
jgi:hypothetical protein